uniref:Uncharacterized protein n=1 Tax=Arundo donax TaxID=35708 RepID=A0A0A8YRN4_ARUDO
MFLCTKCVKTLVGSLEIKVNGCRSRA